MSNHSLRAYYRLTKPGIIYGNAITAIGGFLLASAGQVNVGLLLATVLGISLVIASACVFNNYIDRDIDVLMARTRGRALVSGAVSGPHALIFASLLGLIGFGLLAAFTNLLTVAIALTGFVVYVFVYTTWKRRTIHGTLLGAVSGAVPPVVGYCAVTGRFDTGAFILFMILVFWQMPHFFAIAIYRIDDYSAAKIPVLPVIKGLAVTKIHIVGYIIAFMLTALSLTAFGYAGYVYAAAVGLLGLIWLGLSLRGFTISDNRLWARRLFKFSLVVITVLSIMISVDAKIPVK